MVILISVATEPFIQQLVAFEDTVTFKDDPRVQIPVAQRWSGATEIPAVGNYGSSNPTGKQVAVLVDQSRRLTVPGNSDVLLVDSYESVTDLRLSLSAQASILSGLTASIDQISGQLAPSCPSGNCTWPPFTSLAICGSCSDITELIQHSAKHDYPITWFFPNEVGYLGEYYGFAPEALETYFLPNGLNLDNEVTSSYSANNPVLMTSRVQLAPSKSLTFTNSTTLLFTISTLRAPPESYPVGGVWPKTPLSMDATECGLYLCAKEYESHVRSGSLIENSREIASSRDPNSFQAEFDEGQNSVRYLGGISPHVDALFSNSTYFTRSDLQILIPTNSSTTADNNHLEAVSMSQSAIDGLSDYLFTLFDDGTFENATDPDKPLKITTTFHTGCNLNNHPITCGYLRNITGMVQGNNTLGSPNQAIAFSPPVMHVLWNPGPSSPANAYPSSQSWQDALSTRFDLLATSLSNEIRRNADNAPFVTGSLGTSQTVLKVRWAWITLPAVCVALSFVFLAISVWESVRLGVPVWKGDVLAVLACGVEESVRRELVGLGSSSGAGSSGVLGGSHRDGHGLGAGASGGAMLSELGRRAEEIKVRLVAGDGDPTLMLRHAPDHAHDGSHLPVTARDGPEKAALGRINGEQDHDSARVTADHVQDQHIMHVQSSPT